MAYVDKRLICGDCMSAFTLAKEEQEMYAFKGLAQPLYRCPDCRSSRAAIQAARAAAPVAPSRRRY